MVKLYTLDYTLYHTKNLGRRKVENWDIFVKLTGNKGNINKNRLPCILPKAMPK